MKTPPAQDRISLTPESDPTTGLRGHRLVCPAQLRQTGTMLSLWRPDELPGIANPYLTALRAQLIHEAEILVAYRPMETPPVVRAHSILIDSSQAQALIASPAGSYAHVWRLYLADQARPAMPATLNHLIITEGLYRYAEEYFYHTLGRIPNVIELLIRTSLLAGFLEQFNPATASTYRGFFAAMLDWTHKRMRQIWTSDPAVLATVGEVPRLFAQKKNPIRAIPLDPCCQLPRATLLIPDFFKVLDYIMQNPGWEAHRPAAWLEFCAFARPVSEACPGQDKAQQIYDDVFGVPVSDFHISAPGPTNYPDKHQFVSLDLHKTRAARRGRSMPFRTFYLTPMAYTYLMPILQPMLDAEWSSELFHTVPAFLYLTAKTRALDAVDPRVRFRVAGQTIIQPLSKVRGDINTTDIIRATGSSAVYRYLINSGRKAQQEALEFVRTQMGHCPESKTFQNVYCQKIPEDEAEDYVNRIAPPFTYTLDCSQRDAHLAEARKRCCAKGTATSKRKRAEDPNYKYWVSQQQMKRRKRGADGKCVVPENSVKNLRPGHPTQKTIAAMQAGYDKKKQDPKWRKELSKKQWAGHKKNEKGKFIMSQNSIDNIYKAHAARRRKREEELNKKLAQEEKSTEQQHDQFGEVGNA